MRSIILSICLLFFIISVAEAAITENEDIYRPNYSFVNADFSGMGNAVIAYSYGGWATFSNPAGLVRMNKIELAFQQNFASRDIIKCDPKLWALKYKIWRFSWANKIVIGKAISDYTYSGIGLYISKSTAAGISFIWERIHPADYFQVLGRYHGFLAGWQYYINPSTKIGAIWQSTLSGEIEQVGLGYMKRSNIMDIAVDMRYSFKKIVFNIGLSGRTAYIKPRMGYDSRNGLFMGASGALEFGRLWFYSLDYAVAYNLNNNFWLWSLKFNW